jgi:hypothetical protein
MKRTRIVLIIALIGTQSCRQSETLQVNVQQPPESEGVPSVSCEKAIATQNRINRYFHKVVLPKVKPCWQQVKGQGSVSVEFVYKRAGSNWATETMTLQKSTLPEGQKLVAFKCLQDSVPGTSFSVEKDDGSAEQFFVNWTWPVPLPEDANEVAKRMSSSGTEGGTAKCGDPEGPPPKCKDCFYFNLIGVSGFSFCADACVGYKTCARAESGCNLSTKCATGSLFANLGGFVIY